MKKFFLAATAFVALVTFGPAEAADLSRPVVKAPPPVIKPACANFGGFYIGGHGGWNYYQHKFKDLDNFGLFVSTVDNISSGTNTDNDWHAGVQAGYNWQSGCTVFGVQADWSWTKSDAETLYFDVPGQPDDGFANISSSMRWFGTARARTGLVVDNLMLYVTGGAAFARFNRTHDLTGNFGPPTVQATVEFDRTRVGFVVGAGTEWSFAPNWSFVSEFLYMRFQKDEQTVTCGTPLACQGSPLNTPFRYEFNDSVWVSRIGVNYRFN